MGIKGLMKIIREHAPAAIKENEMKNYFGRKVAIDASMSIYQFLIAVRQTDGSQLQNESGDVTSHLMGMFYRTIRMCEAGLKPLYVFDGKPPSMKSAELSKRKTTRTDNEKKVAEAIETGDTENIEKFSRRIVKCLPEHNEECKRLLKLMGIPYVDAPCEAESQCAAIAKAGKVYASGSEDMDTLGFGTPVLLRHLTFSEARKLPIVEVHLDVVLKEMNLTMDEFIDFSILLGCDYCDSIKGIGPVSALKLIREHSTIEKILTKINRAAHPIPDDWPYKEARELIKNPDVTDPATLDIKWEAPDEEGVVQFLVKEKQFNEERVRNTIQKLIKAKGKAAQGRVDSFFKVIPKDPSAAPKRKAPDTKTPAAKGKGKKPAGKPRR